MDIIKKGSHSSNTFRVARGLFRQGYQWANQQSFENWHAYLRPVKKRFIEEGIEGVLERKPTSRVYEKKIEGEVEAKLVQLYCSEPRLGYAKWSLRLLADKMVELKYVDSISYIAVGNTLKKRT